MSTLRKRGLLAHGRPPLDEEGSRDAQSPLLGLRTRVRFRVRVHPHEPFAGTEADARLDISMGDGRLCRRRDGDCLVPQ